MKSSIEAVKKSHSEGKRDKFEEAIKIVVFREIDLSDLFSASQVDTGATERKMKESLDEKTGDEVIKLAASIIAEREVKRLEEEKAQKTKASELAELADDLRSENDYERALERYQEASRLDSENADYKRRIVEVGEKIEEEREKERTRREQERNYRTAPRWVRDRRFSIHGIDHMETGAFDNDPVPDFDDLYWDYCEAVHSVDENVGRVLGYLDEAGLAENTLVIYMGDNGFHLGEHGFYDKRDAYEPSIRVPMLARASGLIDGGSVVSPMVQNIDIASTVMDAIGVSLPDGLAQARQMDGKSFLPLLEGREVPWRNHILYEYHWEWNFPATPTLFSIRTDRYKYVYHHGTWDIDAFYDLEEDPIERHNLIEVPGYQKMIGQLRDQMFEELEASGALDVPFRKPAGDRLDQRKLE
jgi:N-acetylglucosamine-6-sulfatase